MAIRFVTAVLLVVLLAFAVAFTSCGSDDGDEEIFGFVTPGVTFPELTESDIAAVEQIIATDEELLEALDGNEYTFGSEIDVWREGEVKLGAGVILSFAEPVALEHDWPLVIGVETRSGRYEVERRELAVDARGVSILVDLFQRKVVQIFPFEGESFQEFIPLEDVLLTPGRLETPQQPLE